MVDDPAEVDNPNLSVWLRRDFALAECFAPLLEEQCEAVHKHANLRPRKDAIEGTIRALGVILANLLWAYQRNPGLYVAVSLDGKDYKKGPYNPFRLGYRGVERVVGYLIQSDPPLVDHFKGAHRRYTTRLRATPVLADLLSTPQPKQEPGPSNRITHDTSPGNNPYLPLSKSLFIRRELPLVRLRGPKDKKNKAPFIVYEDTPETRGMKERLERYNAFLALQWIDLLLPNDEFCNVVNDAYEDEEREGEEGPRLVDIVYQRRLYRVFNNSTFKDGGRFYGGWWQIIPGLYRKYITINWAPVVELDFSNMQAAMLYAKEGLPLEGDAYSVDGIDPEEHRDLLKKTFFKIINAADGRVRQPDKGELPDGWTWKQVQEALREKHAPIAKYFNTGIGIELQRVDSDIAEEVMMTMMERDLLVLPVHDSFLTYPAQKERLRDVMAYVYRKHMKGEIGVDADPSFIDETLAEVKELEELGVYFVEDAIYDIEQKPEYSDYRARKSAFMARR